MKNSVAKLTAPRKFDLFSEEIPKLENDYVLVKVQTAGICGSDLHLFRNAGTGSGVNKGSYKLNLPSSLGHECSGIVIDSNKTNFNSGDLVAIDPLHSCIDRINCDHAGLSRHLCPYQTYLGTAPQIGGFREYIILHKSQLFKSPNFNAEEAAMIEPLSTALHAANRISINEDNKILILGAGGIGALLCAVCKTIANEVVVFDQLEYRLKHVEKFFNSSDSLNYNDKNMLFEVRKGYLNNDFDIIFDCITTNESFEISHFLLKSSGKIVIVGIPEVDYLKLNPHKIRMKEIDLFNVRRSGVSFKKCIDFQNEHNLSLNKLITHNFSLNNIQEAFTLNDSYSENIFRAAINMHNK